MIVDGVCNFQSALKVASSSVMSRYGPLCFVMILNRDFVKGSAGKFTFHLSINLRPPIRNFLGVCDSCCLSRN